jgi:hypothetical protein
MSCHNLIAGCGLRFGMRIFDHGRGQGQLLVGEAASTVAFGCFLYPRNSRDFLDNLFLVYLTLYIAGRDLRMYIRPFMPHVILNL